MSNTNDERLEPGSIFTETIPDEQAFLAQFGLRRAYGDGQLGGPVLYCLLDNEHDVPMVNFGSFVARMGSDTPCVFYEGVDATSTISRFGLPPCSMVSWDSPADYAQCYLALHRKAEITQRLDDIAAAAREDGADLTALRDEARRLAVDDMSLSSLISADLQPRRNERLVRTIVEGVERIALPAFVIGHPRHLDPTIVVRFGLPVVALEPIDTPKSSRGLLERYPLPDDLRRYLEDLAGQTGTA